MNETPRNCVDTAINFANLPRHEGAGYHLRLELPTGRVVEGPIAGAPDSPVIGIHVVKTNDVQHDPLEAFVDKQSVVMATIIW